MMQITVLASGSNGNSCLVQDKGSSVLFDAGKSGKELLARMDKAGKCIEQVDAVVISHEHSDHLMGAGVLSRRYGIPVYMHREAHSRCSQAIGKADIRFFSVRDAFGIGKMRVQPVATSHDVPSCGFRIGDFGIFTDTGHATREMQDAMGKLSGVLLESNHDVDMLRDGPYPYFLKQRILSDHGHLSNKAAAELIREKAKELSLVLLGHLSGNNNTPQLARETYELVAARRDIECHVCSRDGLTGVYEL